MVGTIVCVSTITGLLKVSRKLRVIIITKSGISGTVKVGKKFVGTIVVQSVVSGSLEHLVVPEFLVARAINILPVFAHATRVNAGLKRDMVSS